MSLYVIAKFEALLCEEPPLDKAWKKGRSTSELGKSKPVKEMEMILRLGSHAV